MQIKGKYREVVLIYGLLKQKNNSRDARRQVFEVNGHSAAQSQTRGPDGVRHPGSVIGAAVLAVAELLLT